MGSLRSEENEQDFFFFFTSLFFVVVAVVVGCVFGWVGGYDYKSKE